MIEHYISSLRKKRKDLEYKLYISNALRNLIEIQAARGGNKIEYPQYEERIIPKKARPVEPRKESAEDVISRITNKLKKMGK